MLIRLDLNFVVYIVFNVTMVVGCAAQTLPMPTPAPQSLKEAINAVKPAREDASAEDKKAAETAQAAAKAVQDSAKHCWWLPTSPNCVKARQLQLNTPTKPATYDDAINNILGTAGTFTPFNQIQSIYNNASSSATLSADLGTLNFDSGFQVSLVTNVQAGTAGSTSPSSGALPTLSASGAGQAVQNLLYGGNFLGQAVYPVILAEPRLSPDKPDAIILNVDFVGRGGVDIQNFKSGANVNTSSPPVHASTQLEGYLQYNSTVGAKDPSGFNFTGAVFVGGSYGYDYMSHGYARDYGFGNAVHNGIGQVSIGILLNGVVRVAFSRAFGPSQTYVDSTSMAKTTLNNFKSYSIGISYQRAAAK